MAIFQPFCTVKDLLDDMESPGGDVARMYQAILDASDVVQKEIGWFIPVTATYKYNGAGLSKLFTHPLLAVTSVANDGDTLVSTDYILQPNGAHWANGPYSWLEVDPDAANLSEWVDEEEGVEIAGRWGKFERVLSTGATVADTAQQSNSQTTLKLSNGAAAWPGMVLKIGDEQELVTGYASPTASVTALNGNVTAAADTITVDNGALLNVGEIIRVEFEQMYIKDVQGHNAWVIRGWNRTARVAHLDNAVVDVYRTVNVERGVNGTTAAVHANGAAISRYDPPDDIRFLTRQIATLMLNKAKGGYAGRTGSTETGVVYYNDAFPRFEMERIAANYFIPRVR